ncbi:serine hydrolase [Streptomyces sp. NPDC101733]|uniref:D-alanyl-D-alanine carboxypeptidase n=1 Tax=unclassified Streptomyces TaxID=2593676 RepID=UPI003807A7C0
MNGKVGRGMKAESVAERADNRELDDGDTTPPADSGTRQEAKPLTEGTTAGSAEPTAPPEQHRDSPAEGPAQPAATEERVERETEPEPTTSPAEDSPTPDPAVAAAEAEAESAAEAESEAEPVSEADATPEGDASTGGPAEEAEAEADATTGGEVDADTPTERAEAEVEAESESETGADAEAEAVADADPDPDPEHQAEQAEQADPEEGDEPEPSAEAEDVPDESDEPDGDNSDNSDDSTTQTDTEPDTEANEKADDAPPEAEPSDEPAAPAPTTDAAAPAPAEEAAPPESDAERTSKFLALKDLDGPGSAPKPAPARPLKRAPSPEPLTRTDPRTTPDPRSRTAADPGPEPTGPEVTRQAPPPPLELLAELTNTAPPPETPRRTLARRVKVWTPLVLLLGAAVAGGQWLRPLPAPQLVGAQSSYVMDGATNIPWPAKGQAAVRVPGSGDIGVFGEQKPVPTASVAKVMTAYVILKAHPLRKNETGPRIEVDAQAVADGTSEDESRIEGLKAGTTFTQQDMIKMLMIPSGNNIARLLARWDTGTDSTDAFVAKMNAAAKELGMDDTTYTDPSGLDAGTVSTAVDQLKLAEAVMKEEAFRAVVAMPNARIDGLPDPINNNNDNLLLAPGLSIKGIKTGSSTPAGGALMWAAYKSVGNKDELILGTMMEQRAEGADPNARRSLDLVKDNSRKVIEAVRAALGPAATPAVRKGQTVGYVSDGLGGRTPLVATRDLPTVGVPGQRMKLTLTPGAKPVPHEARAGTEVGVLTVGDGDGARSIPVAVGSELSTPSFTARVTRLS